MESVIREQRGLRADGVTCQAASLPRKQAKSLTPALSPKAPAIEGRTGAKQASFVVGDGPADQRHADGRAEGFLKAILIVGQSLEARDEALECRVRHLVKVEQRNENLRLQRGRLAVAHEQFLERDVEKTPCVAAQVLAV